MPTPGVRLILSSATSGGTGEPKNELPFTRASNDDPGLAKALREVSGVAIPAPTGEPKSETPFTQPVPRPAVVPGQAFDWTDAAIGALAAAGIGLAGVGVYLLTGTARPGPRAGAVETSG